MNESQPSSNNPFTSLGLRQVYQLTYAEIERAYLTKIAQAHPDYAGEDCSVDAAALNEARKCLLDAEKRAGALLTILGGHSAAEDKTLPDGFLMEMMQRREEIEDDLAGGGDQSRIAWQQWAADERAGYESILTSLFTAFDEGGNKETLEQCRATLNAWRYIERLIEQLDPEYNPAQADFS
jgi:DnaJ-domain-containing protein 1